MSFGLDDQTAKLPIAENFVTRNSKSIERLRDLTAQSARNAQFARNARFAQNLRAYSLRRALRISSYRPAEQMV